MPTSSPGFRVPSQPDLSPERILQLAARPEGFGVTWRYRDERLLRRCIRMTRKGQLVKGRREPGGGISTFHAPPDPPHADPHP